MCNSSVIRYEGGCIVDEKVIVDKMIVNYFDLQRIKNAEDRDAEIDYQEKVLLERLYCFGVSSETLGIKLS